MKDAPFVGAGESFGDLKSELQPFANRKGVLRNEISERFATNELHRDESDSVHVIDFMNDGYARVFEGGRGTRLLLEAVSVGQVHQVWRQDFESNLAVQSDVEGAINDSHPASTDLTEDRVV